jgi:hypothetical protein
METKKEYTPGSVNVKEIKEAVKAIELYTSLYKRKRLTTENYIKKVHIGLSRLTSQRDYFEYLRNIGQN